MSSQNSGLIDSPAARGSGQVPGNHQVASVVACARIYTTAGLLHAHSLSLVNEIVLNLMMHYNQDPTV